MPDVATSSPANFTAAMNAADNAARSAPTPIAAAPVVLDAPDELLPASTMSEPVAEPVAETPITPEQPVDPNAPPAPRMVHGMEADKLIEAIEAGNVPDELLEKLTLTVDENGQKVPKSLKDIRAANMRASDYGRSKRELAEQSAKLKAEYADKDAGYTRQQQGFNHVIQTITSKGKDVPNAYEMLAELGVDVHALALHHSERFQQFAARFPAGMKPEAMEQLWSEYMEGESVRRQLKARDRQSRSQQQADQERAQLEQQRRQGQGVEEIAAQNQQFLEANAPAMFARHGLALTQASAKMVGDHLQTIFRADPAAPLTADDLEQAITSAKEWLADQRAAHAQQQLPPAKPGALPPRAAAAPAPAGPAVKPPSKVGGSVREFDQLIRSGTLR